MRVDDAVGAVAVHGYSGFWGIIDVGMFATGYPTGINNVPSSFGGQMMGLMTFLPLGFFGGYIPALDPQEGRAAASPARGRAGGARHRGVRVRTSTQSSTPSEPEVIVLDVG